MTLPNHIVFGSLCSATILYINNIQVNFDIYTVIMCEFGSSLPDIDCPNSFYWLISSSSGNPRILIELLKRTFLETKSSLSNSSSFEIDSLSFSSMYRGYCQEKSILPIILIMAIILLPLRYVASITENATHRMIGTIALVVFILFRYLGRYVKW